MRKSAEHKANQETNQKGFTLIELVLSIAILSVVGLAIFGFMTTSSRIYGREVTQTDLQYQSQLVINQLQDLLIDASQSITYTVTAGGAATEVTSDAGIDEATVTQKEICIYNKDDYYRITWDKAEERLYYTRYTSSGPGGGGGPTAFLSGVNGPAVVGLGAGAGGGPGTPGSWTVDPSANRVRMADYVQEFSADLTSLQKNRSVMFRFLFAVNDISYATQHNITLRNQVVKGEGEVGTPTVIVPKQDGIKLHPSTITVWPGDSVVFVHTITSKTGGYPSQEADYSLSVPNPVEASAADTQIAANGELHVGLEEKNPDLKVTVTAKEGVKQEGGSIYRPEASASVHVKQVKGLTVELTEGGTYTGAKDQRLIAGSTLQLKVSTLVGDHVTIEDLKATGVSISWDMEKGAEYAAVDANGLLTVSGDAPKDTILQVKATFNRAGREWAYGYSAEYKVVELKENGFIFVDPEGGEYVAPEGEIWLGEKQKISIDKEEWEKAIGPEFRDGDTLKSDYLSNWHIWVKMKDGSIQEGTTNGKLGWPLGLGPYRQNANTCEDNLSLDLFKDMLANDSQGVKWIEICYEITPYPWWTEPGYPENIIFKSNIIHLDIPAISYLYSYTKDGAYSKNDDLICLSTDVTGEEYVYYRIYGIASETRYGWEGNFNITNRDNLKRYSFIPPIWFGYTSDPDQILYVDLNRKIIKFKPDVTRGSSIVKHYTWGEFDKNGVVINCHSPNVEGQVYYVPLPNDPAYRDSGYLFGDCSFAVTTVKQPGGGSYYKLVITDNRENVKKEITAYCESGDKEWKNTVPMP